MSNVVWASAAMINPANLRPITYQFSGMEYEESISRGIECQRLNEEGSPIGKDYFPEEIFTKKDSERDYDELPDLFFAGSYWVVSDQVAQVMRRFDLGGGGLYPARVLRKDRRTPIGSAWFCLNFGNTKRALRPDLSHVRPIGTAGTYWGPGVTLKDNSIAVSREALSGPDIWIDSSLWEIFFVSDRLSKALRAADVSRAFGLKRCRVI